MCLRVGYKKKKNEQIIFCILKVTGKDPDPKLDPDSLVTGTDPRIRTKMLRIPNTGIKHVSEPLVSSGYRSYLRDKSVLPLCPTAEQLAGLRSGNISRCFATLQICYKCSN